MAMTKAMRMAIEQMRKSMPSKAMNKNDAARVESAIRNNPKMYKGLTPSQVLEMLPPKGRTGEVIGMPINCLLYTSPSPRDGLLSRMPSSA